MADTTNGSKAQAVRDYLGEHPRTKNARVAQMLAEADVTVTAAYVALVRRREKEAKKRLSKGKKKTTKAGKRQRGASQAKYPRHSIGKVLRIPKAILDQNAGKECTARETAAFVGVAFRGPFEVEISSAIKYGLLERPSSGRVKITPLAKKILRPQDPADEINGLREAVLNAPEVSEVYNHFRGENLPDVKFFDNALVDTFKIPQENVSEFKSILRESLKEAKLLEQNQDKLRVVDISTAGDGHAVRSDRLKKLGKDIRIEATDTCFLMMPFAEPLGDYYAKIYEPAIRKAGLRAVRADAEIFGAGKIMDQVWSGINSAKVLVAELTKRNPNVFYELGLAHALQKPVVLVSSNEDDVPFDLHHIRVIYYDVNDPFWGEKLVEKVAENILSAIKHPEEAIFSSVLDETR